METNQHLLPGVLRVVPVNALTDFIRLVLWQAYWSVAVRTMSTVVAM
ncbi:hypothetical protein [Shewanella inventionis]|nr:hypothetical protein [Shewanella inventionis]